VHEEVGCGVVVVVVDDGSPGRMIDIAVVVDDELRTM